MTTHVNKIVEWPPMNSIDVRGYKNANVENLREGYWEPFVITTRILDHINGHFMRPNKVALKYLDLKKDVDPMLMLECLILQWE